MEQAHAFLAVCLRLYIKKHMTRVLSTAAENMCKVHNATYKHAHAIGTL